LVDKKTIEDCKKRDKKAFRVLYESCIPYVYRTIEGYIRDSHFRKDLIQDVFAKVFLKIQQFDEDKGEFKYWLRRITVNECLMHIRSKKTKPDTNSVDITSTNEHPQTSMDLRHLDPDISQEIIERMPEGYQQVFSLVILNGYSHKEASMQLNIAPETSRSQLSRAKKWLQQNYSKATDL